MSCKDLEKVLKGYYNSLHLIETWDFPIFNMMTNIHMFIF